MCSSDHMHYIAGSVQNMSILVLAVAAALAAALSFALTPVARRLAFAIGAVDLPNERKVHRGAIPRLGGLAVLASVALVFPLAYLVREAKNLHADVLLGIVLGLLPVLIISIIDDIKPLPSAPKFVAQFGAAGLAVALGIRLNETINLFGNEYHIGWVAIPLSLFWIVGVTNAFNIVDGLDGLAAGLSLISAVSLVVVSMAVGRYEMALLAAVLAGALLGFLPYNSHPAKIFLGDSGSASIGFLLACVALKGGSTVSAGMAILVPMTIVGLPIAETLVSMTRRYLRRLETGDKRGMFEADRGHFHHRLLDQFGFDQRRAVFTLYGAGVLLAACGLASVFMTAQGAGLLLATLIAASLIGIRRLNYDEFAVVRRGTILRLYDASVLRNGLFVVFVDIALIGLAIYAAVAIKYDDFFVVHSRGLARHLMILVPAVAVPVFYTFRIYLGSWKHATIGDFGRIVAGSITCAIISLAACSVLYPQTVSVTFGVLFTIMLMMVIGGSRASYRILVHWNQRSASEGEPVLIYGAGVAGAMALRELLSNRELQMKPVGFLDDDPAKIGRFMQGLPTYRLGGDAIEMIRNGAVKRVIVSSEKVDREKILALRKIVTPLGATLSYFKMDFHLIGDFEFSVDDETAKGPRVPIRAEGGVAPVVPAVGPAVLPIRASKDANA